MKLLISLRIQVVLTLINLNYLLLLRQREIAVLFGIRHRLLQQFSGHTIAKSVLTLVLIRRHVSRINILPLLSLGVGLFLGVSDGIVDLVVIEFEVLPLLPYIL